MTVFSHLFSWKVAGFFVTGFTSDVTAIFLKKKIQCLFVYLVENSAAELLEIQSLL